MVELVEDIVELDDLKLVVDVSADFLALTVAARARTMVAYFILGSYYK